MTLAAQEIDARGAEVPLLLAGPEPYPGERPALPPEFLPYVQHQTGLTLRLEDSRVLAAGRAGGLVLLESGLQLLHERGLPWVLIGGVDSHIDLRVLGLLDSDRRVLAEGVADGFVPGEGAAFLLLSARRSQQGSNGVAFVCSPGLGREPGHRYSAAPYRGDGLADAIREAVHGVPAGAIETVFCSLNGENFGAKEWGVAAVRNARIFAERLRVKTVADATGDLGAAVGPVLLGLAALGLQRGLLANDCLVWCASEGEQRGAVVVRAQAR